MGSGASLPEFIDPEQCKEIVGETYFNQEKFDSIKETNGKITAAQLTDLMLDSILAAPPSGKRNNDIAPLWDQMSAGWAQVPAMQMKIIELFLSFFSSGSSSFAMSVLLELCYFIQN